MLYLNKAVFKKDMQNTKTKFLLLNSKDDRLHLHAGKKGTMVIIQDINWTFFRLLNKKLSIDYTFTFLFIQQMIEVVAM